MLTALRPVCKGMVALVDAMRRHELTDEQWERLTPLLPPQRPTTVRPNKEHRTMLICILWILRTGAP